MKDTETKDLLYKKEIRPVCSNIIFKPMNMSTAPPIISEGLLNIAPKRTPDMTPRNESAKAVSPITDAAGSTGVFIKANVMPMVNASMLVASERIRSSFKSNDDLMKAGSFFIDSYIILAPMNERRKKAMK